MFRTYLNLYKSSNYFFGCLLILLLLSSCAEENENLVNPATIYETVNVRFLNFAGDEGVRTLVLDNDLHFDNIAYNTISRSSNPPSDSVTIDVVKQGTIEFSSGEVKHKFARKTRYIIVALPSPLNAVDYKPVDTIVKIQTTSVSPYDTNECYLKMFNANNDTSCTYTLLLGCPNDSAIIKNLHYKASSGIKNIYKGIRTFSIVKNTPSDTTLLGVYELELLASRQYAIIINKKDEVFFVDELSDNDNILLNPKVVTERDAYIRVINLASVPITVNNVPGDEIVSNLNSNFIDQYHRISTCSHRDKDQIQLVANSVCTDSVKYPFEVFKKYTVLALDYNEKAAGKLILVAPNRVASNNTLNKAVIRVVNGNYNNSGINVSIGAHDASNEFGYEAGNILAKTLIAGNVSNEVAVEGGNLPITVFTSTEPAKYIFSANVFVENNKSYILVIDYTNQKGRIALISEDDELKSIEYYNPSVFLQVVNVVENLQYANINIKNVLTDAKLNRENALATFVPVGNNTITINGKTHEFNAEETDRLLIIASGNSSDIDIFNIKSKTLGASSNDYKRRYINAAYDVPLLRVKSDSANTSNSILQESIAYKTASDVETYTREKKFTLFFENQQDGNFLIKSTDLLMTLRKNYSVIFYGSKKTNYNILILQEY